MLPEMMGQKTDITDLNFRLQKAKYAQNASSNYYSVDDNTNAFRVSENKSVR